MQSPAPALPAALRPLTGFRPIYSKTQAEPASPAALRPIFRFDSREEYLPVPFEAYIRSSSLWFGNAYVASPGDSHFLRVTTETPFAERYRLHCPKHINSSATAYLFTATEPAGVVSADVGASASYLDIYALVYTVSGKIGLFRTGEHGFDVERVAIRYADAERTRPIGMWFGQHNGGYNVPWASVDKEEGRPVVYVARNSHAMYPYIGTTSRWFGFGNDVCDGKGYVLGSYTVVPISRQEHPVEWEYYGGLARDNGQRLPLYRTVGWTEGFGNKPDSGQKWTIHCSRRT